MASKTDPGRYDRQLRLWGEDGQARLEAAKVCLLNASATGTETLKNLVLPGVGHFTVIDSKKIQPSDLNNFFVSENRIGESRADFVERDPVEIISSDPNFFKQFTVIIATQIPEEQLKVLAKVCWDNNIALFVPRAYGLIGYLRVVVPEHTIVDSRPDNPPEDLRLYSPWPELAAYADSFDLDSMNSTQHSHTPYVILLLKYLKEWKATHDGKLPSSYSEKSAFRDFVIKGARKAEEENFNEAYKAVIKHCAPTKIAESTQNILNDAKASNITADSDKFWILAAALKEFVANEGGGLLPVQGSIPDMTATTEGYVTLQKIYQDRALKDVAAVTTRVQALLNKIGKPADWITKEEIAEFCKNANVLQCIRYRSLEQEYSANTAKSAYIDPDSNLVWYIMLRAADRFYAKNKRYPGESDDSVGADTQVLQQCCTELLSELNITATVDVKFVQEMVRFGNAELHPMAALIGGIAAQEVIKVITHKFVPLDNTLIHNGLKSTSCTVVL